MTPREKAYHLALRRLARVLWEKDRTVAALAVKLNLTPAAVYKQLAALPAWLKVAKMPGVYWLHKRKTPKGKAGPRPLIYGLTRVRTHCLAEKREGREISG